MCIFRSTHFLFVSSLLFKIVDSNRNDFPMVQWLISYPIRQLITNVYIHNLCKMSCKMTRILLKCFRFVFPFLQSFYI